MKKWKRMLAVLLAAFMVSGVIQVEVFALDTASVDTMYQGGLTLIDTALNSECEYGNEWQVITLARAGKLSYEKAEQYYASLEAKVRENGSSKFDPTYMSTREILAVVAIGKDPTSVAGYNLLEPLGDLDYVTANGYNTMYGSMNALVALDTKNYTIPDVSVANKTTREALIQNILTTDVVATGGWSWDGTTMDADETAMAIQALAPYYNSNANVKTAVDNALIALSLAQNADGSFNDSYYNVSNTGTTIQVLIALSTLGIDAQTDVRFIKGDKTILDALQGFYNEGSGFRVSASGEIVNALSTAQGTYGLNAYQRLVAGKTAFYNMSDATPINDPASEQSTSATEASTEATIAAKKDDTPKTGDTMPVALLAGMALFAASGAVYLSRKKNMQ